MKKLLALFIFLPLLVFADQYAIVSSKTAANAKKILDKQESLITYCEPCGDQTCKIEKINYVDVQSDESNKENQTIYVNNNEIDLAYTFVKSNGIWQNLAVLLGLKPEGISNKINANQCMSTRESEEVAPVAEEAPSNDWPYICGQSDVASFGSKRYFPVASSDAYPFIAADTKTIQIDRKNKTIKVWSIWLVSPDGQQRNIQKYGPQYSEFGYLKRFDTIKYSNMMVKVDTLVEYQCNGNVLGSDTSKNSQWSQIIPESVMEGIMQSIMKKYNLK